MADGHYRSFAKINLHLAVDGRRADGYHELFTLFQTVDLHDRIRLRVVDRPGVRLRVPDGGAPADRSNLAHRAATAVLERWAPGSGAKIELVKRIPAAAGLGGGSSNAATVLAALAELLPAPIPGDWLAEAARRLGADVPYFLIGGTALGTGRGDRIEPLPELAAEELLLVDPGVPVPTAEVFGRLELPKRREPPPPIVDLRGGQRPASIAGLGGWNDLEGVVLERFPAVRTVYNALRRAGATCVRLSGSGGTVFACFEGGRRGREAAVELPASARTWWARILSRDDLARLRVVRSGSESDR